jgi:hypothetical protein
MIIGYVALSLFFFATFAGLYRVLGVERIFQPDSYEVAPLWWVLSAAISLVGSMLAGYVCAAISRSKRTCQLFAGIILVVLILFCIPQMRDRTPHPRAGEISYMDAIQRTQMPIWMHLLNPVLGGLGVLLGAGMKKLAEG